MLVTARTAAGDPAGVAPDMARAIADELGLPISYVTYLRPGELADAAAEAKWDIGLIGAEPARATSITFSPAYCEIASTYLVPPGSPLAAIDAVDRPGIRIATAARAAYTLWLERNIRHAEIVVADSIDASFEVFRERQLDVLAGLEPRLIADRDRLPGARILPGHFAAVQQSIGVPRGRNRAAVFLRGFVQRAITSGLVGDLIRKHGVIGLTVAPAARENSA